MGDCDDCCACSCCLLIIGGIVAGIVCMCLFIPHAPSQKVSIINANLTHFELTVGNSSTSLFYNLSFTMSMCGDSGDYHDMEVDCYYSGKQFDSAKLENYSLNKRRTRLFNLSRSGNSSVNVGSTGIVAFRRSNETGFFDLEIWLKGKWLWEQQNCDQYSCTCVKRDDYLSFQCKLRLQLITSQNTSTQSNFQVVKCH